jgi:hypothetical protein
VVLAVLDCARAAPDAASPPVLPLAAKAMGLLSVLRSHRTSHLPHNANMFTSSSHNYGMGSLLTDSLKQPAAPGYAAVAAAVVAIEHATAAC